MSTTSRGVPSTAWRPHSVPEWLKGAQPKVGLPRSKDLIGREHRQTQPHPGGSGGKGRPRLVQNPPSVPYEPRRRRKAKARPKVHLRPAWEASQPEQFSSRDENVVPNQKVLETTKTCDRKRTLARLPAGSELVLSVYSTWGDPHYVGLTGIEMFDENHGLIQKASAWADPSDGAPSNLLDGVNQTSDDRHAWFAPFTKAPHLVGVSLPKTHTIAAIRVWNYQKTRIHSFRGARYVEMTLDGVPIFKGEISRGSAEVIYFTHPFPLDQVSSPPAEEEGEGEEGSVPPSVAVDSWTRPRTSCAKRVNSAVEEENTSSSSSKENVVGRCIEVEVLSTYNGDDEFGGLAGVAVLEKKQVVSTMSGIEPASMSRVFSEPFVTDKPEEMVRIKVGTRLKVDLGRERLIEGLKVWNYNAGGVEGASLGGVRTIAVYVDGRKVSPERGFLLRKAPGHVSFDFGQVLDFFLANGTTQDDRSRSISTLCTVPQQYQTTTNPTGHMFKLEFLSNYGDPHYLGLNGLEFIDRHGAVVPLRRLYAEPSDLNSLPEFTDDPRTVDKLADGVHDRHDGASSWLAPFVHGATSESTTQKNNVLYVCFDAPVTVAALTLWNYTKTPSRAVRDFCVYLDDALLYRGALKAFEPSVDGFDFGQSVLFSNDPAIVKPLRSRVYDIVHDDLVLIDQGQRRLSSPSNFAVRPATAVVPGLPDDK